LSPFVESLNETAFETQEQDSKAEGYPQGEASSPARESDLATDANHLHRGDTLNSSRSSRSPRTAEAADFRDR
jgi:hypothetical protein